MSARVYYIGYKRTGTIVLHVAAPYLKVSRESGEVPSLSHSLVLGCANLRNYVLDPRLSTGDGGSIGVSKHIQLHVLPLPHLFVVLVFS